MLIGLMRIERHRTERGDESCRNNDVRIDRISVGVNYCWMKKKNRLPDTIMFLLLLTDLKHQLFKVKRLLPHQHESEFLIGFKH